MPNEISTLSTVRRSLVPTTYAEAFEFAQHLAKSTMVPTEYRGKPENILLAIQWGMEVGLAPLQAIQNIAVINGKPSVYGDALLAMVKGSPVCDDVVERFEGSGDTLTAICEAKRIGKAPVIARFSVADATTAALWRKAGPWTQYPRRMLQMRARGFALRDAFPDILRGVITREEADDYPVDVGKSREPVDVTPRSDLDRFAAPVTEVIDPETGEVTEAGDTDALAASAMAAAKAGVKEFMAFYGALSDAEKAAVKSRPEHWLGIAKEADAATASSYETEDAFGLPPLKDTASQGDLAERPAAETLNTGATARQRPGEPSADPLGERDPTFWRRRDGKRVIEATDAAGFMAALPKRLAECESWAETDDIERHNAATIRELGAEDRSAVARLLAERREQVRGAA